jgi:hypothetical protein
MLYGMLSQNFQQRLGVSLSETQASRLERALEHYMSEVFETNPNLPVQTLNKEVISATASDFTDYIQRKDSVATATPQMFQDASQRYDQLQQDRQRSLEAPRPAIPDYVQPMVIKEDDSISALSLFEEAKKRRNMEVSAQAEEQLVRRNTSANQPIYSDTSVQQRPDPRSLYDMPLDLVAAGTQNRELSGRADMNMTLARPGPAMAPRGALQQDMLIKQEDIQSYKETEFNLSIYSADRDWEKFSTTENRFNFSVNLTAGNSPTGISLMPRSANRLRNIVRIEFIKAIIPIEVTDIIVRKVSSSSTPDSTQAVMNAHAIAIGETKPSSAASLNLATITANTLSDFRAINQLLGTSGVGVGGAFLKPNKSLYTYDTSYSNNIYSFPFITLNVSELDTNTYGTNDSMDNAFGVLQYDSNWTDNTKSLGFTSLIPKHMKCQRIYAPTPLATLNKLTIRLQQPNGKLINESLDTIDISGIFLSQNASIQSYFSNTMDLSGTAYSDLSGEYIWLDCKKWFNRCQVMIGDRIQIKNLSSVTPTPAVTELIEHLQNTSGLIVVGTAYSKNFTLEQLRDYGTTLQLSPSTSPQIYLPITSGAITADERTSGKTPNSLTSGGSVLVDGSNRIGYSRFIIVRGKFNDPTTGSMAVKPYGNQDNNFNVSQNMVTGPAKIIPGKLINLSRQTQLIFRVITREYDSTSLVRPDNL